MLASLGVGVCIGVLALPSVGILGVGVCIGVLASLGIANTMALVFALVCCCISWRCCVTNIIGVLASLSVGVCIGVATLGNASLGVGVCIGVLASLGISWRYKL